jgi:hypothetical protein
MAIAMSLRIFSLMSLALAFSACSGTSASDEAKEITTEISLQDLPASVKTLVTEAQPDFVISEVLKKERGSRVYYDVEGELSDGSELEFDVLMQATGPEIVEIQRDLDWSSVPEPARKLVENAKNPNDRVGRVIESKQTDGAIIYEVFLEGDSSNPRFEVWAKDSDYKLLSTRWEH